MSIISILSKSYDEFEPVVSALKAELGPRFPVSMQNWCGIGERPYPLLNWHVYLGKDETTGEIVGVFSYYQQDNDPPDRFWVGWIGVLPSQRRKGFATKFLDRVKDEVIKLGGKELWVHTGADNIGAIDFYKDYGMQPWGEFKDVHVEQASAEDDSAVLWMSI